jgi:predicted lipid-binding transport protein (Tim44 family)
MTQPTESPTPIAIFPDRPTAEAAHHALQEAGFSTEQLSVVAQDIAPSPPVEKTEAKQSAKGGAMAGAMFGALAGLLLSVVSTQTLGTAAFGPIDNLIGMVLAGSGIGAIGGSAIAALMGASVYSGESRMDYINPMRYLVLAEGTEEELVKAKTVLEQQGYLTDKI